MKRLRFLPRLLLAAILLGAAALFTVALPASVEQFANGTVSTTLANAMGANDLTLTVASTTGFPTSGNFRVLVDTEIMTVTAVSGTTFTVSRASESWKGSAVAATHTSGSTLSLVLTAGALTGTFARIDQGNTFTGTQVFGTPLGVASGGTGAATLTANGVLYGAGAGTVLATTQGAANSILTANAGAPSFSATPTIGTSLTVPTVQGSTSASGTLTLSSTSNGTKGKLLFGTSAYDEVNSALGIGTATPQGTEPFSRLTLQGSDGAALDLAVINTGDGNSGIILNRSGAVPCRWIFNVPGGSNALSFFSATLNDYVLTQTSTGNVGINTQTQFGSGSGVIGIKNAATAPTTNPSGGGVLYIDPADSKLKYRGSSGTVTTLANP